MKKIIMMLMVAFALITTVGCTRVKPGEIGVLVKLNGGDGGSYQTLEPNRYFITWNEDLYIFPTSQQNYVWTKDVDEGSETDESITFQTKDGMSINCDIGITYNIKKDDAVKVFQKYRKGVNEITDVVLRTMVRNAFSKHSSKYDAEQAYSTSKNELLDSVIKTVTSEAVANGINVENIYYIGSMRLPTQVVQSLNSKIQAIQDAQRVENELRTSKANAEKAVADAEGRARAILVEAEAQAQANRLLSASLTPTLVENKKIEKWNGVLPQVTSGNTLVDLR